MCAIKDVLGKRIMRNEKGPLTWTENELREATLRK